MKAYSINHEEIIEDVKIESVGSGIRKSNNVLTKVFLFSVLFLLPLFFGGFNTLVYSGIQLICFLVLAKEIYSSKYNLNSSSEFSAYGPRAVLFLLSYVLIQSLVSSNSIYDILPWAFFKCTDICYHFLDSRVC